MEIFYQPVFSARDGMLSSLEALARWNHPTLGYVSPGEFIPLAEECGLIDRQPAPPLRPLPAHGTAPAP
ncbi:EAL domain-containing protein, partial [Vibrio cholerae]|uniref:EAL domain-containing protein n=1 Tax=Vibrio cholerae TaxID=666 RepID=UPI0039C8FF0D